MAVNKLELDDGKFASCALFKNVKNTAELRQLLIAGNLRCSLVKPSLIADLFQIHAAANKALIAESHGKLTTKSVYTEILFNLSLSKNISQSLLKFGIGDTDASLMFISFEEDSEVTRILSLIEGEILDTAELNGLSNTSEIRKMYKISDSELRVSSLINVIVSKIATKDFVNY